MTGKKLLFPFFVLDHNRLGKILLLFQLIITKSNIQDTVKSNINGGYMFRKIVISFMALILELSGLVTIPMAQAADIPEYRLPGTESENKISEELPYRAYLPLTRTPDPWAGVVPAQQIVWWHQHTGTARLAAIQQIVDNFNANNGYGITVTAEYAGGYSEIFNKMLPLLNTLGVPDLVSGYQNQLATYQLEDAMFNLDELFDHQTYGLSQADQADFFPGVLEQDVFSLFDNDRLGISPNKSMEVLYYNQSWLTELDYSGPPTTPAEFQAMGCAAAENPYSGAISEKEPMGYQLSMDASRFASWTFAFGGDVFDKSTNQYTLNSPASVAAMEFLQSMFADGCAFVVSEIYGDQIDFGNGTLLFAVSSSSGIPYYKVIVDLGAGHDWSVDALPTTTATPRPNVYGPTVSIPKSTPERELSAWLFLKHLTSAESQTIWVNASGYFPTRASTAAGLADYFAANPIYKKAFDLLEYGMSEPSVPGYDFVRNEIVWTMANLMFDTNLDVQTELDALNAIANQILADQLP